MDELTSPLRNLLAQGKSRQVLKKLQQIFSLSESELGNNCLMLQARLSKFRMDCRDGILDYNQETLEASRINRSILSLIEEIEAEPSAFQGLSQVEERLEVSILQRGGISLSPEVQEPLLDRISYFKGKEQPIHLLWLDDGPGDDPLEAQIFNSMGISLTVLHQSSQAAQALSERDFQVMVSDIYRGGYAKEGLEFFEHMRMAGLDVPTIFYVGNLDPSRGVPPYAKGITNYPPELIHLVLDVLERKY